MKMIDLSGIEGLITKDRCTPDQICSELARLFSVRVTEVGLLYLDSSVLKFLYPVEFQSAGCIPITSSAVAARTAQTRKAELFNNFVREPHHTFFEQIKLKSLHDDSDRSLVIQKLISAPVIGPHGEVLGVVQIARKGTGPADAGPNFNASDLDLLERAARRISILLPGILVNRKPQPQLRFHSCAGVR